ncbi:hypothetical protein SAMN05443637_11624 [Pseudonocardia thermophila]|jgi:hypothetical protein|uniref:Uncharacterized protein n=1 Tax=Pseudonocardia thermophila TaxID=1848 RepID=A0A1M6X421_PSETH|nr:hypothetical protein [Pseudonocardia thermophila]SHL00730.1 hypothetical protein SAMN05443637_11624 [Pseudonocardia thermophila]
MVGLHRDPELLRAHSRTAAALAATAAAAVDGGRDLDVVPVVAAEVDRLVAAVGRAVAELEDTAAALAAAAEVAGVDAELADRIRRALGP